MNSFLMAAVLFSTASSQDPVKYPAKPGPRDFILDEAKLIQPDQAAEIRILCDEALSKKKAPIIVVTIPSLAAQGATGWPIERYALNLMSEWGVGWEDWNYGMLLLVSPGDRKARIELGGSWARRKDDEAKKVMAERIIPRFKQGDYSRGILEGVRGLHDIAFDAVPSRGGSSTRSVPNTVPLPAPKSVPSSSGGGCLPGSGCILILVFVVGVIAVLAVFRMFQGGGVSSWGSGGPGYYGGGYYGGGGGGFGSSFGGGLLGSIFGSMVYDSITRRGSSYSSYNSPTFGSDSSSMSSPPPSSSSDSSDSSDFGGGSFGGGFSGGGGATGEW
jgi:uncharacterized protein